MAPSILAIDKNVDVSVVILTKNSAHTLGMCLKSVIREKPGEIIAVDARSSDKTLSILKQNGVGVLLDPHGSLSFSRQLGVESAKGDFVFFVDSDVELDSDCIATLRLEMQEYGWAGIHARLQSAENASYWQKSQDEAYSLYYGRAGARDRIDTIAAMFRRDVLLRYPFDPYFRESAEDVDLCRRLVAANQRLGVSTAIAYHHHRRGFPEFVRQRFRNGVGTARLYVKYREKARLVDPVTTALSLIIRNMVSRRVTRVPFWVASGVSEFLGVLYGLGKICRTSQTSR
jgi:glycosyltransferase involved in cell wall biosynthesis